jgi:pimeloyl-ACP methyl ester carboxylesterase
METTKTFSYAPVNGISMYYEIYGEGDLPLVLIHGGGSTIQSSFGNLLPLLTDYGKIIAVELQAHGRTNDRDAAESFEQDADDVAALLKHLKISKANILGFSNGGTTTLQIAVRHPQLVHKLISIAGAWKREGLIPGFFEGMQGASLDNMPHLLKDAYLNVNPDRKGFETMFEKDKQRMIDFRDYNNEDLKAIQAPALMVVADKDVITVEHTAQMAKLIPNAQLLVLPGVHGTCIGEICSAKKGSVLPVATALLIKEFLYG